MTLRLFLLCHAATAATRAARFPLDEPADPASLSRATSRVTLAPGRVDAAWTSPALRCVQTAAALDLAAQPDPALAELDYGRWAGTDPAAIAATEPAAIAAWFADPASAPHGGESVAALLDRVAGWLAGLEGGRVVAVTHASVIRAAVLTALGAPAAGFRRIDVAPLCCLRMNRTGGLWTLRSLGPL